MSNLLAPFATAVDRPKYASYAFCEANPLPPSIRLRVPTAVAVPAWKRRTSAPSRVGKPVTPTGRTLSHAVATASLSNNLLAAVQRVHSQGKAPQEVTYASRAPSPFTSAKATP